MAKRRNKNKINAKFMLVVFIAVIIIVSVVFAYGYFVLHKTPLETVRYVMSFLIGDKNDINDKTDKPWTDVNASVMDEETVQTVSSGDFSVHFLELGNKNTGDCIYIKAGDNDILIDAGSKTSSIPTIKSYLDNYVTDNTLEYVIVTHAHEDHIAGFAGTTVIKSLFRQYECETIIDFPMANTTSKIYQKYLEEREEEVRSGAKRYSALECYNEQNGARRVYELSENTTLTVLYNYYYENKSSSENDYSVCVLFTHDQKNYLFTGDLESKGEKYLLEYNDLPVCELYKAGHHGSKTSSSKELLATIKPKTVCVCCCAGNDEYTKTPENQFPTQEFINRIAPYTDAVYVTSMGDVNYLSKEDAERQFGSFNGTIIILANTSKEIMMFFGNNSVKLKDSEWFKNMRTMPEEWASAA